MTDYEKKILTEYMLQVDQRVEINTLLSIRVTRLLLLYISASAPNFPKEIINEMKEVMSLCELNESVGPVLATKRQKLRKDLNLD
jgi:hypothetical protein